MRKWRWSWLIIVLGGAVLGQTPQTRPVEITPEMSQLIGALGSADFAVRDAAQKTLDGLGKERRDELDRLAEQTTDPEAKARLAGRVRSLDEGPWLNPPPISIDVKDASLREVGEALSAATGCSFQVVQDLGPDGKLPRYTLMADHQPYWEVLRQLDLQHPMTVNGTQLIAGGAKASGVPPRNARIVGPYMMGVMSAAVSGQNPGGAQTINVRYFVVADPRMQVAKAQIGPMTEVLDAQGRNVTPLRNAATTSLVNGSMQFGPGDAGTLIKSARGEAVLTVVIARATLVIEDPGKHARESWQVGHAKVQLARVEMLADRMNLELKREMPATQLLVEASPATAALQVEVLDAAEKRLFTRLAGDSGALITVPLPLGVHRPLKLRIGAASKVREVAVPIELNDIQLPLLPPGRAGRGGA